MYNQTKVSGVILAGGLARRMNNRDKGLILFKGKPMIYYAIQSIAAVVDEVLISANRNLEAYQQFAYPVLADETDTFDGPLAGVLTAMKYCQAEILLVMPCDSPLFAAEDVRRMRDALCSSSADIAVAFDGQRMHPVFLVLHTALESSLHAYLQQGQRKIDRWFEQHDVLLVDFSKKPEIFKNINTLDELASLENE